MRMQCTITPLPPPSQAYLGSRILRRQLLPLAGAEEAVVEEVVARPALPHPRVRVLGGDEAGGPLVGGVVPLQAQ